MGRDGTAVAGVTGGDQAFTIIMKKQMGHLTDCGIVTFVQFSQRHSSARAFPQ
jgi:hypothetical protein